MFKQFSALAVLVFLSLVLTVSVAGQVPPDTTPSTECTGNEVLEADGTCTTITSSTDDQTLEEVLESGASAGNDNMNMNNQNINDLASIDGGGNGIGVNDNLVLNQNAITSIGSGGELRIDDGESFPSNPSEATWGSHIVTDDDGARSLKLGVVNDGEVRSQIKLVNNNSAWGRIKFKTGNGNDATTEVEIDESGTMDLNNNNLNNVGASSLDFSGGSINFNSGGGITSVNNINVGSFSSNNGNSPIDFNQGLTVSGDDGGAGDITMESGVIDFDHGDGTESINNGEIQLQPGSSGGSTSISFESNVNSGSDGGFITWHDDNNNYNYWGDGGENGALVMGVTNDGQTSNSDVTVLKSSAAAVVDAPELRMEGASLDMSNNAINNVDWGNSDVSDFLIDENNEVSSTDWNTLTEPGMYGVADGSGLDSSQNQPSSAYDFGHLMVTEGNGNSNGLAQFYIPHQGSSNNALWYRTGWNDGSWSSGWKELTTKSWVNNNADVDTNANTECSDSAAVYLDGAGNCQDLSTNTGSYINGDLITKSIDSTEIQADSITDSELDNSKNFNMQNLDINGGSNRNNLRLINKVNDPDSPAPLLIATDDDGEDLAIEVRSNSDGGSVNTSQNFQDTPDTKFRLWSDGETDFGQPSNTGDFIDIEGNVQTDGKIDLNGNKLQGISSIEDANDDQMINIDSSNNDVEIEGGFQLPTGADAW